MRHLLLAFVIFFIALNARAIENNESRIRQLEEKLRCLVCQNQSLADSNAELAGDLRREVREQVAAGRSDAQIMEYLVQRYGDFVLYSPPFKATTALLWIGPALLLLIGAAVLGRNLAQRRQRQVAAPLTEAEHARARTLLAGDGKDERA